MSVSGANVCPECGALRASAQARCWLCERKGSAGIGAVVNPYASPRPIGENSPLQFSIASLLLVTTLVAVCLGVFLQSPGLGIFLSVMTLPAVIRTIIDVAQRKRGGAGLGVIG